MRRRPADIRLSGSSLAILAAVSVAAAALIISGGSGRTPAQLAALAALREHPAQIAELPTQSDARAARSSAGGGSVSAVGAVAPPAPATGSASSGASPAPSANVGPSSGGAGGGATGSQNTGAGNDSSPQVHKPTVGHLFEISLSTTSYETAFGAQSAAPYLRSLEARGALLSGFESLGASELSDNLALVSGQGPNPATAAGCTTFAEFRHGVNAGAQGLVPGSGCVYPETALTIGDQVSASGHVWKAYIADMGKQACAHPNSNAPADVALPGTDPGYDPTHNPFIYFHSLLDLGDCASDDEDLGELTSDLADKSRTATFSFIAPGACEDATATVTPGAGATTAPPVTTTPSGSGTATTTNTAPVATSPTTTTGTTTTTSPSTTSTSPSPTTPNTTATCPPTGPVGISAEDAFLRLWVPRILASAAYKARGVLIIAFAAAGDQHEKLVRTGALVLSRHGRKRRTIVTRYGPYSLLRSEEDALGYTPLAHAKSAPSFASALIERAGGR